MSAVWDSWQRPYRHAIVDAVRSLGPVESLVEGGCHCGPNLRLLRAELPHLTLAGFDRSPHSIAIGQARLPSDVKLERHDWYDGPPEADVVLSCYSLAYIHPNLLPHVLHDALTGAARVALIIAEPMPTETEPAGRVEGAQWDPDTPEYVHDYEAVLGDLCVPRSRIERRPQPRWERLNGLLVVKTA